MHDVIEIIRTKRDGGVLSAEQIRWVLDSFTRDRIAPEQMSALLMAIVLRGLGPDELAVWTAAMIDSGVRRDLSGLDRPTVDKHSTGGVGDKITLALAPVVAACGAAVPQLSGRGLGHTGGTLDKLESIPGWRADLSPQEFDAALRGAGAVVCAAGADLAPADRKLYALRDVTGTVESLPLIASSIMSKKIAEGAGGLVLDVKVGSGAFLPDESSARRLAETMVRLGAEHGLPTVALLTAMDRPLGRAVGNALEVAEAVEVLAGGGPQDVVALTCTLAARMLDLAGIEADPAAALRDGRAMDVWRRMIRAQGGDPDAPLPEARAVHPVPAAASGRVRGIDAYRVGAAAWRLGAGRTRPGDEVSPTAGVLVCAPVGTQVAAGDTVLELHTDRPERIDWALAALEGAVSIDGGTDPLPLVLGRVGG